LTADLARRIAGTAIRELKPRKFRQVAFSLDAALAEPAIVEAVAEGALLADFETDRLKTDEKLREKHIDTVLIGVPKATPDIDAAFKKGLIVAGAQNFTRNLVNEPSNLMTPPKLAEQARALATEHGLRLDILDEPRLKQLGCGALLGVAQGSIQPPCLIHIEYIPEKATDETIHLALVGKGVTFYTRSLHQTLRRHGEDEIRHGRCGVCSGCDDRHRQIEARRPRLGLRPLRREHALEQRPAAWRHRANPERQNRRGPQYGRRRPPHSCRHAHLRHPQLRPTHIVDAATLTGAIVVALGHIHAGLFTNNDELRDRLVAASKSAGESLWPMPLDDDYKDYLKSPSADLPNIGGRWGGAVTAAKFLESFADSKPWAHLDIAGTAWLEEDKPYLAKGPSGLPVRTFVELALAFGK